MANLETINEAVRLAGESGKEVKAVERMCDISGIKLAVASAILTICYPQKFTIIDRRVLEVLALTPADSSLWTPERYWKEFVRAVKKHCRTGYDLRTIDKALWGLSVWKTISAMVARQAGGQ